MSVLSFPRLYLRGEMSWDPIVSNNGAHYDTVRAEARFRDANETVAEFRARLIEDRTDWNYFGTHLSALQNVALAPVRGHGASRAEAEERARALLARFGLEGRADERLHAASVAAVAERAVGIDRLVTELACAALASLMRFSADHDPATDTE